ncbi:MAG: lamin tail domain-containing protein [Flavobacteriales bacterium]|nr:lamin tail domain-containing protein [Flavobacteriales bacterium]
MAFTVLSIPEQAAGRWIRYYIEAQANTAALTVAYSPAGAEHDVYLYQVITNTSPSAGVVINELMASNVSTVMDENDQYEDWIELYNGTGNAVDLEGWYLTDTPSSPRNGRSRWHLIAPDSYLMVWADETSRRAPCMRTSN